MVISKKRVVSLGTTPHPHEAQAIEFALKNIPDTDPFLMWGLLDLVDRSGKRYDLDLVVLGYHALYLIEIKSHPARFEGGLLDWKISFHDGGVTTIENPLRLNNHKAKVLKSLLNKHMPAGSTAPWVQSLVFLSHPKAEVKLRERANVITCNNFAKAIQFGEFPGADNRITRRKIDRKTMQAVKVGLKKLGLRESAASKRVGGFILEEVLAEGDTYQDHAARNESIPDLRRRVRTYHIGIGASAERRGKIERAAMREAQALTNLAGHKNILSVESYIPTGPTGAPCLIFEHFDRGIPLGAFLRSEENLTIDQRLSILEQVASALSYCHHKKVLHRGLSPNSVLVRYDDENSQDAPSRKIEVRLFNFQLAARSESDSGTHHITTWAGEEQLVYVAPEVIRNPSNASEVSDVFSLGAVAFTCLTGQPPGEDLGKRATLLKRGFLSPATMSDEFAGLLDASGPDIDDAMQMATCVNECDRVADPSEWIDYLYAALSAPPQGSSTEYIDPLEARKGDDIDDGWTLEKRLGEGATARGLRVATGDGTIVVKVALSGAHDERLEQEAEILKQLHDCPQIVNFKERRTLGGRMCLALSDAGKSLAQILAKEGLPSLDYARRWGEDLLLAVQALEEKGIQHRDIKPANLGVINAAQKKKRHLCLFDFSISSIHASQITAGTPAYRDPFLQTRGSWDAGADRYAVAITLHEVLTGSRPVWDDAHQGDTPRLFAERFDPTVRERLISFFSKALRREESDRYASAEDMRTDWLGCFAALSVSAADNPSAGIDEAPHSVGPLAEDLQPTTPVAALSLSVRARNALDRAGVLYLSELLVLPSNQYWAMRGVGRNTAKELQEFADSMEFRAMRQSILASRQADGGGAKDVFCKSYGGLALPVESFTGVPVAIAQALSWAGIGDLRILANADATQVQRIVESVADRAAFDALRKLLSAYKNSNPDALGEWIDVFFGTKRATKRMQHMRCLFGLEQVEGRYISSASELARVLGITRAAISLDLVRMREQWNKGEQAALVVDAVEGEVMRKGGAAPIDSIAGGVARRLCGAAENLETEKSQRYIAALCRLATEVSEGLVLARTRTSSLSGEKRKHRSDDRLWVTLPGIRSASLNVLGEIADALAGSEPLPSAQEVKAKLRTAAEDHGLGHIDDQRLLEMGAAASTNAVRSPRLELYPRGMAAKRALDLSLSSLPTKTQKADVIRDVVQARYPEAEALPMDEDFDRFVEQAGLLRDDSGEYRRGGQESYIPTAVLTRYATTDTAHQTHQHPESAAFQEAMQSRIKRGAFCVLDVQAGRAAQATEELCDRLALKRWSLDEALIGVLTEIAELDAIPLEQIFGTDREGPSLGGDWNMLCSVMQDAASRALDDIRQQRQPLLLTDPGLLARYSLSAFLAGITDFSRTDEAPAVFLMVPRADESIQVRIPHPDHANGGLAIPVETRNKRLAVPDAWIRNANRGNEPVANP